MAKSHCLVSVTCLRLNSHVSLIKLGFQKTNCCFSHRLEGTEEKFRNRESRSEDLQIIAELRDMVTEREALVKKLVVRTVSAEY